MSGDLDDAEWLRRQLAGDNEAVAIERSVDEPAVGLVESAPAAADYVDADGSAPLHDLGDGEAIDHEAAVPRRYDRRVAAMVGGVALAGVLAVLVGAAVLYGHSDSGHTPPKSVAEPAAVAATATSPPAAPTSEPGADRPLPFTASAACPPGSTSAQTLAGADPANAFVCVRDGVDGQVIDIDLGKTYVVSAISITPGWIGSDSSGASQWVQHRVVTRVQYLLINGEDRTVLTQETGNVHGEAVQPVKRVLASRITMLVLQTSRPPAETATPSATPTPGGLLDGVFGPTTSPLGEQPGGADPVDATFAISNVKIIGHEAI